MLQLHQQVMKHLLFCRQCPLSGSLIPVVGDCVLPVERSIAGEKAHIVIIMLSSSTMNSAPGVRISTPRSVIVPSGCLFLHSLSLPLFSSVP